jgi:GNAT superfamily N-acetyltransferase
LGELAGPLDPPRKLDGTHDLSGFDCGEPALGDWLRQRGLKNQVAGASQTYVVTRGNAVAGYYCLSAGSCARIDAVRSLQRNMPDPIPVLVLGRLAVDRSHAGQGIGSDLLKDAVLRTLQVAEIAGIAALLLHAKDKRAAEFYLRNGFRASTMSELMLMLSVREMASLLG